MNRTYEEWVEKVTNTSADIALADMLADWQADIIQRTKAEHLLRVRANALELREAELEADNNRLKCSKKRRTIFREYYKNNG